MERADRQKTLEGSVEIKKSQCWNCKFSNIQQCKIFLDKPTIYKFNKEDCPKKETK